MKKILREGYTGHAIPLRNFQIHCYLSVWGGGETEKLNWKSDPLNAVRFPSKQ